VRPAGVSGFASRGFVLTVCADTPSGRFAATSPIEGEDLNIAPISGAPSLHPYSSGCLRCSRANNEPDFVLLTFRFIIPESQNPIALSAQPTGALLVVLHVIGFAVLGAVNFDNKSSRMRHKVEDVAAKRRLTSPIKRAKFAITQ
jgi:hypothetical protein